MATRYLVATGVFSSTSIWSTSSGGSPGASVPTGADAVIFNAASGAVTVTIDAFMEVTSLTCTGFTGTMVGTGNSVRASGNVTLAAGMAISGAGTLGFQGASVLTSAGKTIPWYVTVLAGSHSLTLADAMVTTQRFTLGGLGGSFNAANFAVTAESVNTSGSLSMGSATWTITGSGYVWVGAGTITPSTSTIKLTNATSSAKIFDGGGKTYGNIWLTGAGTGEFQFSGSNTFADFKCDTPPHTIKFTAGTTTTVTTFTVSGTAGNLMTIGSLTASAHTLTKAGGGVIEKDYLSISNSTAGPSSTWYAGLNSSSGGNTSGWVFGTSSTVLNAGLFINSGP